MRLGEDQKPTKLLKTGAVADQKKPLPDSQKFCGIGR